MRPIALLGVAVVLLVGGCGSESQNETTTSAASASTAVPSDGAVPSDVMSSIQAEAGIPPEPDPATWRKYINALNAIDPEIVNGKEEKAVDGGRDQCSSVKEFPDDQAKLVDLTNRRFLSPNHPDGFGKATAAKILAAVRKYICPTY